ncbi:pentatricopeptide repeat-containing protein At5g04780, mitochondrial [Gossypium hirsutum]|uniref:Pentatricopeptide repeat-containing protein At5g04780, mitochondrial n=1 Tax=Gossypium hirsutum TaxID=3635 RepID=A0ABM3BNC6_GOSHI|nr:pentatricopeptide repeat-containing protein At5g04780, mitochondrial-like [Gossypium hirsutum]
MDGLSGQKVRNICCTRILHCKKFSAVGVAVAVQLETPTPVTLSRRRMSNTFVSVVRFLPNKACHARAIRFGLQEDTTTSNILINVYCKSGLLSSARKVFDGMPARSLVSWNTLIGSYAQNGEAHEALNLFKLMQRNGSSFSEFTISSVVCASVAICAVFVCKQLHGFAVKAAVDSNVFVGTALADVYAKSGLVKEASRVFESMQERSVVTWSCMVVGYVQNELFEEALLLFHRAQKMEVEHDHFILSSIICGCAGLAALIEGKQVHAIISNTGFCSNIFVASSLIDMYAKCGSVEEAYTVFLNVEDKNVVSWNAMISGFAKHARALEAMISFEKMQQMGLYPNEVTYISVLSACSHMGLVDEAKSYFDLMITKHNISPDVIHYSCMVDTLGRAGMISEAYDLIQRMPFVATASMWGSLLACCRFHGNLEIAQIAAKHLFEMGLYPNEVTYISVLSACSHMGLVDEAKSYFDLMITKHNISPDVIHYSCMVDTLGRAGMISEAYDLIQRMPFVATASMWGSLLACCRFHGNLEIAQIAAKHLFEMEPDNAGNYILLSNIYAANKKWEEVVRARKFLKENVVKNEKGKSWIAVKDKVHKFMVGEINHPRITEIYSKLDSLVEELKILGYKVETEHELHDVEESRKQELLKHHSEKLALSFGLLSLPASAPIRIMKNLRICGDCYSFMKHASSSTQREIIVRDINRFHHFRKGRCFCSDFW